MKHHSHHAGLHPVKLNLSKEQIRKAARGHQIQVAHSDIGVGHIFHVHPETHKKLHSAHKGHRGARVHITHHELAGSGFLDFLKTIASPVLSGLQGVAKELLPSHAGTIDSIREGIRGATGYGLRPKKQMHHGHSMHSEHSGFAHGNGMRGPHHFPAHKTDFAVSGTGMHKKHHQKKGKGITQGYGTGIMPAGYGY